MEGWVRDGGLNSVIVDPTYVVMVKDFLQTLLKYSERGKKGRGRERGKNRYKRKDKSSGGGFDEGARLKLRTDANGMQQSSQRASRQATSKL